MAIDVQVQSDIMRRVIESTARLQISQERLTTNCSELCTNASKLREQRERSAALRQARRQGGQAHQALESRESAGLDGFRQVSNELHATVIQVLFAATLVADVLPNLWERSPSEGMKQTRELRQLTHEAYNELHSVLDRMEASSKPDVLRPMA